MVKNQTLECLNCGEVRRAPVTPWHLGEHVDCPRCGYVGWAESESLSESLRRALRERPVEKRRLHLVAW
jgi:hypothetical protein